VNASPVTLPPKRRRSYACLSIMHAKLPFGGEVFPLNKYTARLFHVNALLLSESR
jgi:hypothetical protein